MNNVSITIVTTDNRTQALGYDAKFYESTGKRNADISSDLSKAAESYGDVVAIVYVAEWSITEGVKNSNGIVYDSIDEVAAVYPVEDA